MSLQAGDDVQFGAQLSDLEGLLVVFMHMTECADDERILQLATSSLSSLSGCSLVGVYMPGAGWRTGPKPDGSDIETLEAGILQLDGSGGTISVDGHGWAWAYPLGADSDHAGFFVVANEAEPSPEELLLVRLLAWGTGSALGNARRHALVRSNAERLTVLNENLERRISSGFNHSPIGMSLSTPDGRFVQVNRALCEITGRSEEELLAAGVATVTHPADREWDPRARELMIAGELEAHQREKRYVRPNGEIVWAVLGITLIRDDGGRPLFFAQIQDITQRKLAEQRLREALEKEQEAAGRLREIDQLKDEFLAVMSHELRTPLTPIVGLVEALINNYDFFDDKAKQELLKRVQHNAKAMTELIRGLLDFSRLQADRIRVEPQTVMLGPALERCIASVREATGQRRVSVHHPGDIEVNVDPNALARIVTNLLTNAAKYSPPEAPVEVTVEERERDVVVSVADLGPGIPAADRERVFERFWQGAHQPPGRRGAGLGLAIAQRYVELSGGRIWVDAGPERGSKFSFTLPKI
ncbi:MAG: ATP-binding protein [Actinomycetota bacterium]